MKNNSPSILMWIKREKLLCLTTQIDKNRDLIFVMNCFQSLKSYYNIQTNTIKILFGLFYTLFIVLINIQFSDP